MVERIHRVSIRRQQKISEDAEIAVVKIKDSIASSDCSSLGGAVSFYDEMGHLFQAMSILHGYLLSSLEHQPLLPPLPTSESFLLPNQYGHAFFTVGTSVPRCRRACSCAQITHSGSSDANGWRLCDFLD